MPSLRLSSASTLAIFACLFASACGASDTVGSGGGAPSGDEENGDGGSTPGAGGGGGNESEPFPGAEPPENALPFTLLRDGSNALLGIAGDDAIVIHQSEASRTLEAVPLSGGPDVVITALADGDRALVRGGVVAFYRDVTPDGLGTLGLWTRAGALKQSVATSSPLGFVFGSPDGARVAFGVNGAAAGGAPLSAQIAVTSTSAPSATPTSSGIVNLAEERCSPDMGFVGQRFFAAFCTPTVPTRARLVTVDAQGVSTTLVTNPSNGGIQPYFSANDAGTRVFVIGPTTSSLAPRQGRILTVSPPSSAPLENNVSVGVMLPDGSAAIYQVGAALKRATTAAVPVSSTLVASGVSFISELGNTHAVFHTQGPVGPDELLDVRSADLVTPNQTPVDLVPTPTVSPVGLGPNGADVLYLGDNDATGATLKAIPVAGGPTRTVASSILGVLTPPEGAGVVVVTSAAADGDALVLDLGYAPLTPGPVVPIAAGVAQGAFRFAGKRLVYARPVSTGGGLFVSTLP